MLESRGENSSSPKLPLPTMRVEGVTRSMIPFTRTVSPVEKPWRLRSSSKP